MTDPAQHRLTPHQTLVQTWVRGFPAGPALLAAAFGVSTSAMFKTVRLLIRAGVIGTDPRVGVLFPVGTVVPQPQV